METTDPDNVDRLNSPQPIPEAFLNKHYCQHHLMAAMGIDEPTFWGLYVSGRIPRGVSLMALTSQPLVCWPRHILDTWNNLGRPPKRGALELENEVLHSLMDAFRDEGVEFPTCPPVLNAEQN